MSLDLPDPGTIAPAADLTAAKAVAQPPFQAGGLLQPLQVPIFHHRRFKLWDGFLVYLSVLGGTAGSP